MLPFLKNKQEASVAGPVETIKRERDEDSEMDLMEIAASDIIEAVHAKNSKNLAQAIKAAFELFESEPHEEGEHV